MIFRLKLLKQGVKSKSGYVMELLTENFLKKQGNFRPYFLKIYMNKEKPAQKKPQ
jgi:hypothetical protein